jgi:hypothetical protein
MMGKPIWVGFVSVIVLAFVCGGIYAFTERGDVAEATLSEVDTIVGVDADPTGNGATSVGTIDRCISVSSSETFYIDLFVKDVTDLYSWDGTFSFNESVVQVNALQVEGFFLGSIDQHPLLDCYEDPVGDNGRCVVSNGDGTLAGPDGQGVLGRLELTALTAGTSRLYFTLWTSFGVSGVTLLDNSSPPATIGDLDSDNYFDGLVFNAIVVVGEPCPADPDLDGFTNDEESVDGSDLLDVNSTPEICDEIDNDLDGNTDEWYDRDPANGTADCVDPDSNSDGTGDANPTDPDDDDDGFSDEREAYLGTDSLADCAVNQYHNAWPLDINNDKTINLAGDVFNFVGKIGSLDGDGNFRRRLDLDGNGLINLAGDVAQYVGHIGDTCP